MKSNEIRKLFEGNEKIVGDADTEVIMEINQKVPTKVKITEDEMSYYVQVSIMELASKDIEGDTMANMKNDV